MDLDSRNCHLYVSIYTAARLRVRERGGNKPLEIINTKKSSVDVPVVVSEAGVSRMCSGRGSFHSQKNSSQVKSSRSTPDDRPGLPGPRPGSAYAPRSVVLINQNHNQCIDRFLVYDYPSPYV
jgi:hypothetical protein